MCQTKNFIHSTMNYKQEDTIWNVRIKYFTQKIMYENMSQYKNFIVHSLTNFTQSSLLRIFV